MDSNNIRNWERHHSDELPEKENHRGQKSSTRALWLVTLATFAALIAAAIYGYGALGKRDGLLARLPSFESTLAGTSKRVGAAEEALQNQWASIKELTATMDKKLNSNLRAARKQAQEIGAQVEQRLQAELNRRVSVIQARLNNLESGRESDQTRLARLQEEIDQVRRESSRQIARMQQDRDSDRANGDAQFNRVGQQIDQRKQDLDTFARRFDRERIDFEAGLHHKREVAPGITLEIDHMDVSHQRYDGWVFVMPDRRTLWVRSRGLNQPLVFYSQADHTPRQLVVTRVTKNSVIGYVLLPAESAPAAANHDTSVTLARYNRAK